MPPSTNLSDWITRRAAMHPDRVALDVCGDRISYADMAQRIAATTGALKDRLGVAAGDRIAYLGHNSALAIVLFFAAARLGAIYMPLNWRLAPREHAFMLADAEPTALVVEPAFQGGIAEISKDLPAMRFVGTGGATNDTWIAADDLIAGAAEAWDGDGGYDSRMLLCYTSGTTGRPKGAVLRQEAVFYNAVNSTHMHDLTGSDRVLTTLPLFHVGGLNIQTTPAFHAGATVFLHPTFDPAKAIETLVAERITLTVFVPAQISALMAVPRWAAADLSALRAISTGSTIVPTALIDRVHERGIPVIQVYGSTETSPIATYQTAGTAFDTVGSTGKQALHCDVKTVDPAGRRCAAGVPGEVLVRGPNVFCEYWNNEQATAEALVDGWFRTGDVGHFDENGDLTIDDRIKDMIISGGENIYPAALEQILLECPDIAEAAVVARPDPRWDEVPVAVIAKKPDASLSSDDVMALFDGAVARFQHPKDVLFVEALPRNAMGKVLKDEVRKIVAAK